MFLFFFQHDNISSESKSVANAFFLLSEELTKHFVQGNVEMKQREFVCPNCLKVSLFFRGRRSNFWLLLSLADFLCHESGHYHLIDRSPPPLTQHPKAEWEKELCVSCFWEAWWWLQKKLRKERRRCPQKTLRLIIQRPKCRGSKAFSDWLKMTVSLSHPMRVSVTVAKGIDVCSSRRCLFRFQTASGKKLKCWKHAVAPFGALLGLFMGHCCHLCANGARRGPKMITDHQIEKS